MIQQFLDISTGYVTQKTANLLDSQSTNPENIIMYPKGEYGWFVYVPEEINENYPSDLIDIMLYAKRKNCQWIMFDRDGDDIDDLTKYEW